MAAAIVSPEPCSTDQQLQQKFFALRAKMFKRSKRASLIGLKVLIVEDSEDNQILFQMMLAKEGAEVDIASNGIEAISQAMESEHHLILMDIKMPLMGGHEATRTLRQLGYRKPIVALTACSKDVEQSKCVESGFNHFISKPLQPGTLISLLHKIYK